MTATPAPGPTNDTELISTLVELVREVASVLDLDELLAKIPSLIARLTEFTAFGVYLLDEPTKTLSVPYSIGYPTDIRQELRVGQGVVGAAVEQGAPILVGDVDADPRYRGLVPGMHSQLAVPLRRKGRVIGALNLLSDRREAFTVQDETLLRQFAAHVAVAIENARLFESERKLVDTLETLAEIGREVASILDLDELLTRIANLTKRIINYRTFGIFLVSPDGRQLDLQRAIRYGNDSRIEHIPMGQGLIGWAAEHRQVARVGDVSLDQRYIPAVDGVRSELVIPLLIKDRCIGVFDLESTELDAFSKEHEEVLTLLASHAAVAIENARLYEQLQRSELRMERELRIARRVQIALQSGQFMNAPAGVTVAGRFESALELGGDLHDFRSPTPDTLTVAVGDVSGKGVPAALYSAFTKELIRSRTLQGRYRPDVFSVGRALEWMNTQLHERQLEEFYCTLCYAQFDVRARKVVIANSGLPYPLRWSKGKVTPVTIAGVPLGTFEGTTYEEITLPFESGDVFVFCTDGVYEATNAQGEEFGVRRTAALMESTASQDAEQIVGAIFEAVRLFTAGAPQHDDLTAVAVRIA